MNNLTITLILIILTFVFIKRQRSLMRAKIDECNDQGKLMRFESEEERIKWLKDCVGL